MHFYCVFRYVFNGVHAIINLTCLLLTRSEIRDNNLFRNARDLFPTILPVRPLVIFFKFYDNINT